MTIAGGKRSLDHAMAVTAEQVKQTGEHRVGHYLAISQGSDCTYGRRNRPRDSNATVTGRNLAKLNKLTNTGAIGLEVG